MNPGEDIFLAVYSSNTMVLFSEKEYSVKMIFEKQ